MRCPDCMDEEKSGTCEVTLSNIELKDKLKSIESKRLQNFSFPEFQIMDYLNSFNKVVSINKIASTLDKGEKTVIANINKLIERGLVSQDMAASQTLKKEVFTLTVKGSKLVKSILKLIEEKAANNTEET